MKILYLDYDGVLHHKEVFSSPRRGIFVNVPGRTLFEWAPILENLLLPHSKVKIVLATSWVRVRSFDFAKRQLSVSLQERVIGATFHHRHMDADSFSKTPRGVQIANDALRRGVSDWFAIDDDHDDWPASIRERLICTNGELGISEPAVQFKVKVMLERL